jgi:PHD/YefM family antitoxin component YafN of YafNO toxin-antitoxin module
VLYNLANLANKGDENKRDRNVMSTKVIASTEAQNNFGRILDDVVSNGTRYIVRRRNTSQAIILSLTDFESILQATEPERKKLERIIREISPVYSLGETVEDR